MRTVVSSLFKNVSTLFVTVFRIGALAVALALVFFPAFKEVWAGYVPLLAGFVGLCLLWAGRVRLEAWLTVWPPALFLSVLLGLPALIQTVLVLGFQSQPVFDGLFVYRQGVTLAETGAMDPLTYYAPGQIWYYGLAFRLFGASFTTAQWAQIPLMMAIPWVAYRCGLLVTTRGSARLAALSLAVYPGLLFYVLVAPYYYYLYTLCMLVMIWAWLYTLNRPNAYGVALVGGVAAGFGALTKATLLVAPLQALFFWFVTAGRFGDYRRWLLWVCFTAAMALTITPWQIRNHRLFDTWVPICTSGPLVFYSANNPESNGLYSPVADQVTLETPQDKLEHMAWCNEQAWAFIRSSPDRFLELIGLKFIHTWGTATTYVELINRKGATLGALDPALRLVSQVAWAMLVFAWAWVSVYGLNRRRAATPLEIVTAIIVLSKFLIYSVYEGGSRHHLPAVPLLMLWVLAAHSVWSGEDAKPAVSAEIADSAASEK